MATSDLRCSAQTLCHLYHEKMRKIEEPMELHEDPAFCNLKYLRTLLTCGFRRLERAVEIGSAASVRWILDHKNCSAEELDKALISELVWKFPESLDAFLKNGARRRKAFNSINPCHVLFTFCSYYFSDNTSPMSNMLETLRVLTSYPDVDINSKEPEGSYPLYTLIYTIFECYFPHDRDTPSQKSTYMTCLEMLLQAGANPNFDEIKDAGGTPVNIRLKAGSVVFRSCQFSSALNGVFFSLKNVHDVENDFSCLQEPIMNQVWLQHLFGLLGQTCRLMLQHGSNPNHINVYKGTTPLHDLMELWARKHSSFVHRYFDQMPFPMALCQVQSVLLSYGADPNKSTLRNSYPVCYYVTEIQWKYIDNVSSSMVLRYSHVLRLLQFMDSACAVEAGKRITEYCHALLREGMPAEPLEEIQNSVWRVLNEARTLLSLSQLAVWKAIGRNFHAAEIRKRLEMNIPKKILHDLDNMFVCHCQY